MDKESIIRAWKDEEFRSTLSKEELAAIPEWPIGFATLKDEDLETFAGGAFSPRAQLTLRLFTLGGCCDTKVYLCTYQCTADPSVCG